jgi:hypothetical protein
MARQPVPCEGCPFVVETDDQLAERRDYVDRGGWVACRLTEVQRPAGALWQAVQAMRQETECAGARIWRRDRRRPPSES